MMLLKNCSRCQFGVPVQARICHICGNSLEKAQLLGAHEQPAPERTTGLLNSLHSLSQDLQAVRDVTESICSSFQKELGDTAKKSVNAARSMWALATTREDDHDRVLSFHKEIGRHYYSTTDVEMIEEPQGKQESLCDGPAVAVLKIETAPVNDFERMLQLRQERAQSAKQIEQTSKELEVLMNWFEQYGKNGILLPKVEERQSLSA